MQINSFDQKSEGVSGAAKCIANEIDKLRNILLKKQADYGDSAFNRPFLNPKATAEDAILTRLSDKFFRLHNIQKKGRAEVEDETLEDTVRDIAGYCILFLANRYMGAGND